MYMLHNTYVFHLNVDVHIVVHYVYSFIFLIVIMSIFGKELKGEVLALCSTVCLELSKLTSP